MNRLITFLICGMLILVDSVKSEEVNQAYWPKESQSSYKECNFIFTFICSNKKASLNVNEVYLGAEVVVIDENNKQIKEFKVRKIHYEKKDKMCWITHQPIRYFDTYFVTNKCFIK